ncbi:MAG: hypothetical protein Q7S11_03135 [bacterium]|nr:hypothetical protein [bacterium]
MKNFDIKRILKRFVQLRDKDKLKMEMTPHSDWRMLFVIFTILIVAVGSASYYIFLRIQHDDIFLAKENEMVRVRTFNTQKLKDTIGIFEQRKKELEMLRAEKPSIIDPSI